MIKAIMGMHHMNFDNNHRQEHRGKSNQSFRQILQQSLRQKEEAAYSVSLYQSSNDYIHLDKTAYTVILPNKGSR